MGVEHPLRALFLAATAVAVSQAPTVASGESSMQFEDMTAASGIDFRHGYGSDELTNLVQTTGPGVALFDADADGDLDIYFVNGAPLNSKSGNPALRNALYINDGAGSFHDGTEQAGVGDTGTGMAAAAADYDNDGDCDLYVCNFGPNVMYLNRGDGTFEEVTDAAGVGSSLWSASAAFADVDNDGHLDLFVANYLDYKTDVQPRRSMLSYKEGYRFFPGPYDFSGVSNSLFMNNGDGTFRDASAESGIERAGKGMGCSFSDLDLDGDVDLTVVNDRHANFLYKNDGEGHFEEVAVRAQIAFDQNGFETGAMGVATGDIDGDGYPDLLITNMIFEYNAFYRNLHDMTFEDASVRAALDESSYETVGWGVNLADFDYDGDLDAFVANGHVQDYVDTFSESIQYAQGNLLFENRGDGRFLDVTAEAGSALDMIQVSRGSACGDLNGDGLIDIVIANSDDAPQILVNVTTSAGRWLRIRLEGVQSNKSGIGATIRATAAGVTRVREVGAGSSYASQSEIYPRIGLAGASSVERLEIDWPGGGRDLYTDLPVDRELICVEGVGLRPIDNDDIMWTPEEAR
jgi:enediyne biosynthesis protein E4